MKVNKEEVIRLLDAVKPARLIAATKYVDIDQINQLEKYGCLYYGENRVQAFLEKYEKYQGQGHWHFIGTLQTNKVKYIIDKVELIHSVNSYALIDEIQKQALKRNLVVHILIQVNIAKEESKHGFHEEELSDVLNYLKKCSAIIVDGLMMMAPYIETKKTRVFFQKTKALLQQAQLEFPQYPLHHLSMGMSHDYKIAIEEGATLVRIGSALFKDE